MNVSYPGLKHNLQIISDSQKEIFSLVNYVVVCGVISLFGTVANIINLIIFYNQGLNTTINISLFSLTISDLCSLILQQFFNVYVNPLFYNSGLPIVFTDVQYITTAIKRELFAKITCFITVYITAERCLCITFPLHVKQMITPRRTTTVIVLIYSLTFVTAVPLYCTYYIDWTFYPKFNKTLLGLAFTKDKEVAEITVFTLHAFCGFLSFVAVIIFTCILIYKLREKSAFRKTATTQQDNSESMSNKDRATMSMVALIACILIICYSPSVVLFLTTFFEPEFAVGGMHYNLFYSLWTFGLLTENINSSVNIFLYFKMSTKYRQTFRELFSRCIRSAKKNESGCPAIVF